MVPERFLAVPTGPALQHHAVFHGTPYGRRQSWMTNPILKDRLHCAKSSHPQTRNQRLFDELQQTAARFLEEGQRVTAAAMNEYVQALQHIRLAEFSDWMAQLPQWPAIVNLPSLAKFYGGRVFEGMAAGRPVISWDIPSHPGNRALFEPDKEILLFHPDDPATLAKHIDRILHDRSFADSLAQRAQDRVTRYHTAERRLRSTLDWIRTGAAPDYGLSDRGVQPTASKTGSVEAAKNQDEFYVDLFVTYVYSGSLVVRGQGRAEVTATGPRSEIGKIGMAI